jgi:hypothetical protein
MRSLASAILGFALLSAQASAATEQPYVARVKAASLASSGYLVPTGIAFCGDPSRLGTRIRNGVAVERLSRSSTRCGRKPLSLEYVRVIDGPDEGQKGYMRAMDLVPAPDLSPTAKPKM